MTWLTTKVYGGAVAILAVIAAVFALRRSGIKQGRQEVNDELSEAYNNTTKEVRNVQTDVPSDPVAVLDSLRQFAERGERGGDT